MLLAAERRTSSNVRTEDRPDSDSSRDASLLSRVDHALCQAGRQALRRVQIYVDRSHVTLRGQVRSYYEKQLAQHVTLAVSGVCGVSNQLAVR